VILNFLSGLVSSKGWVLAFCIGINLMLHLPFMDCPPQSIHVWRQCNTLAVARNFYEENMNPLRPRVDRRLDTSGETGMQFPAYEYLVALGYELVGEHNFVHRTVSFLIDSWGVWGIYELFLLLWGSAWAAALGAWCFCWSPELFYFGFSALPDVLALASSIWALYWFLKWREADGPLNYAASLFGATLAGLTKIQFLAIGFPIGALVLLDRKKIDWKKGAALCFYALVSVGVTLGWYAHAVDLIRQSGLRDFGLEFKPASGWASGLKIIGHNLTSELPELLLNYATFIFFVVGMVGWFRRRQWQSRWFWPFAAWAAGVLAYYLVELGQMSAHSYYLLPFIPLLLVFAVEGALFLKQGRWRWLFLALLVLQPVVAFFRIIPPRFWNANKAVALELYNGDSRQKLEVAVPNGDLCLVGPDPSGCIDFYFLHKKGFGFNRLEDLTASVDGVSGIQDDIRRGARFLYTDDTQVADSPLIKPYLKSKITQVGNFRVFELRKPKSEPGAG
jgi:Dolichyl-phosphate-mannose-protein mannosyltransferase